jgi:hypothetical protein
MIKNETKVLTIVPDPGNFWGGSGSSDPCFWLMDPDTVIFVIDLQDASQKLIFSA